MKLTATAIFSALLLLGGAVCGQTLTRIAEVTTLSPDEVVKNPHQVKLQGVVTYIDLEKTLVTLNDGEHGVGVILPKDTVCPELGDQVEVTGRSALYIVAGFKHPRVLAEKVRSLGRGSLPTPKKLTLPELNSFNHFEQWVSVQGQVSRWKYQPSAQRLTLSLVGQTTWTMLSVQCPERPDFADKLMGAQLRLTGINAGINTHDANGAMLVPSMAQIEVLQPGWKGVFDAPLVSMEDIKSEKVPPESRVKVRGIVVGFRRNSFQVYLRGADGAQLNALQSPWTRPAAPDEELMDAGPWPALKRGDEVEMVGSTGIHPSYPLHYSDVRVIGQGLPAPPQRVEIETLMNYQNTDDWVSVEGHVVSWTLQGGSTSYVVDGPHQSLYLILPDTTEFQRDLYGARVRLTGITRRTTRGTDYYVPSPEFFEILRPGKEDRFASPEHSALDIATSKVPLGEPVKVKGLVIGQVDRTVYLRCQGTALCVKLCASWGRPAGVSPTFISDGTPHPTLKVGDEVEVVGTAIRAPDLIHIAPYDLVNANVRITGHQDKVEPVQTTFERVLKGGHTADLVQVRGRLLTWQTMPLPGGQWRNTLLLKSDGKKLTTVYQGPHAHPFDTLKPDDDVLLQAVVDRATAENPLQLRVLTPEGAQSLGYSSDLLTRSFWSWALGGATLVLMLSGWIIGLSRSNRIKTEAAVTLEARVQERTAALERAQADLSKALDHERELGDLKSRFVSMVSHEFRTPLGVTMSAVEIIRQFDERLTPEKRRELCDEIYSSTCNMAGLMEQVLLLGRVEAGKLGYKPELCDLAVVVGKLVDESLSATGHRCPVSLEIDPALKQAHADEALIRHIISNLVGNASKYSPSNTEVLVTAKREGREAVFEIIDHGIGIPEKDLAHLYEAFHRCTNVGEIPGTGLGLVIVKRCVDLHGGTIAVRSVVHQGTTFHVRLPVFPDALTTTPAPPLS